MDKKTLTFNEVSDNLFFSPMPAASDPRAASVTTFSTNLYPELVERLNQYSRNLKNKDNHRLIKNYINLDFNQFPFATMLKKEDNIVGFCAGYTRDFYRKNDIRILTRYYQDKQNLRVKFSREVLRPTTLNVILQQIEMSIRLGFSNCFITREPKTNDYFAKLIIALNNNTNYKWEFNSGPFLVAPDPKNIECWQSIAVANLNKTNTEHFWKHWRAK